MFLMIILLLLIFSVYIYNMGGKNHSLEMLKSDFYLHWLANLECPTSD